MAVNAYLNFNGNCREDVEYYTKVFGQEKPQIMAYGDTPLRPYLRKQSTSSCTPA